MAQLPEDDRATAVDLGDLFRVPTPTDGPKYCVYGRTAVGWRFRLLLDRTVLWLLHCLTDPIRVRHVVARTSIQMQATVAVLARSSCRPGFELIIPEERRTDDSIGTGSTLTARPSPPMFVVK